MKVTNIGMYALRLSYGSSQYASQSTAAGNLTSSPDKLITRSATMLAVFGIALSSFSLKQLLANNSNRPQTRIPLHKF